MPRGEQFRRFYPGLIPVEQALWRAFLVDHETDFDSFEYNVYVGQGLRATSRILEGDPQLQRVMEERWRQATQKKIDVVARKAEEIWIIEVHERADPRALGQLQFYEHLLRQQRPNLGQTVLALVTRRIGPDAASVFVGQGVRLFKVLLTT